ncbi:MAG: RHS repeat protein [Prevotella sp.]|nr:RHS repeat protein [Prevotella sp.]
MKKNTINISHCIFGRLFLLLLISCISHSKTISAVTSNDKYTVKMPDFPYKSPEAAAFQKYGEYNFSEYTGTPNISVPLYTIQDRDLEIPLNLTYDASGIKVDQEASWVGLGWNLLVGGCINYVPAGQVDKYERMGTWDDYSIAYDVKNSIMKSSNFKTYNDSDFFDFENGYIPKDKIGYATSVLHDLIIGLGERDYFSVNVLGKSFSFFFNPYTCKMEIIGKASERFQITPLYQNGTGTTIECIRHEECVYNYSGFIIKDAEGNTYKFMDSERTYQGGFSYPSAWNLTQIVSADGAVVNFKYSESTDVSVIPKLAEQYIFISIPNYDDRIGFGNSKEGTGYQCTAGSGIFKITKSYLSSIETDHQTLNFELSKDRNDLKGGFKLLSVSVSQNDTKKLIKSFRFNYDYFIGSNVGGDYMQINKMNKENFDSIGTNLRNRLKLLSVDELSNKGQKLTTSFEYNDMSLPLKTSYATDFWGYFNGEENVNNNSYIHSYRTSMPSVNQITSCTALFNNDEISYFRGGNRFTNVKYTDAGLLKKIVYPTKGYTVFSYESNTFSNYKELMEQSFIEPIKRSASVFNNKNEHTLIEKNSFIINRAQTVKVSEYVSFLDYNLSDVMGSGVIIQRVDSGHSDKWDYTIRKVGNVTDKSCTYSTSLSLLPGTYIIREVLEGVNKQEPEYNSRNMCSGTVEYIDYKKTMRPDTINGGGVRVKSIMNYDSDNRKLTHTDYRYSGGKLLCPVSFGNFFTKASWHLTDPTQPVIYEGYTLSNSSLSGVNSFVSSMAGGTVGYSRVKKNEYDSSNILLKTTESEFANEPATNHLRNFYQFDNFANGLLLKQTVSDTNKVLSMVNNTYSYFKKPYTCNIMFDDRALWDICEVQHEIGCGTSAELAPMVGSEFRRFYSVIYSYYFIWNKLEKSVHTTYDGNGTESTHEYSYNNINYQIATDKYNSSEKNVYYTSNYKYPCDEQSDSVCSLMVRNNVLTPVVRQNLSRNDVVIKNKCTKYGYNIWNFCYIFNPKEELFAIGNNDLESRLKYTYDEKDNVQSMIKDNSEKITYLWSYNYTYPVAEIKGADYDEICNWIGTNTITTLAAKTSPSESDLLEIRNRLASRPVLVTLYFYDPGIGVTSVTAPNGNKTTYTYDEFNKLATVKNDKGEIISSYSYNYKQ